MLPVTHEAAELLHRLAAERGVEPALRVRVVAGGCSGLTWELELGAAPRAGDHRRTTDGILVLVDARSASHLRGAQIALAKPAATKLRTPLAGADPELSVVVQGLAGRTTCGCGESFAPA